MPALHSADRDQVVIVTQPLDPHADEVIGHLEERHDVEVVRLWPADLAGRATLTHRLGPGGSRGRLRIHDADRVIDAGRVRSVWWRRPGTYDLPAELDEAQRRFADGELDQGLRGFLGALECHWVDDPEAIKAASWKSEQLARAAAVGFTVPRTLVTVDRAEVEAFYAECDGDLVYKVMGDAFLGRAQGPDGPLVTPTRAVTPERLDAMAATELVPCMFQERVPKARELRVTAIGEELYAAAVTPYVDGRELLDWHGHEAELRWEPWVLPVEVARRCRRLVDGYGLRYGALDLILTPDGDYVFLELNPAGQFLFVEWLVPALPLSAAFAAELATAGRRPAARTASGGGAP